jgi:transposase InsO family protein
MYRIRTSGRKSANDATNCGTRPYKAQLVATAPNQVWSWTSPSAGAGEVDLLFCTDLDIFSRYVVAGCWPP